MILRDKFKGAFAPSIAALFGASNIAIYLLAAKGNKACKAFIVTQGVLLSICISALIFESANTDTPGQTIYDIRKSISNEITD